MNFTVPYRLWSGGGIALSKDEFEELQTFRQYISGLVPQEIEVQEALNNGDSVSDDELAEKKIGRSNISALMRSSRQVRAPAGYNDFL